MAPYYHSAAFTLYEGIAPPRTGRQISPNAHNNPVCQSAPLGLSSSFPKGYPLWEWRQINLTLTAAFVPTRRPRAGRKCWTPNVLQDLPHQPVWVDESPGDPDAGTPEELNDLDAQASHLHDETRVIGDYESNRYTDIGPGRHWLGLLAAWSHRSRPNGVGQFVPRPSGSGEALPAENE
jgi:hypothetical protein